MVDLNENNPKPFYEKIFTEKTGILLSFISLAILIVAIFIFLYFGSWQKSSIIDEPTIAQFGDFVGGVIGTLVAFIGIILYYVALTEQRNDIKINQRALNLQINALDHQTIEFQAQKEELISTRKIYEQQTKTMKNQQFDSNFYSLLNVYVSIKNNLNESDENHDFFNSIYEELTQGIQKSENETFYVTHKKIIEYYTNIYFNYRGRISPYFKTIYRLLMFVDDCDHLKEDEKVFYSKIVRSQISDNELLFLYYNYHSIYGTKAQPPVLKYRLLKHIQRLSKIEFIKHFDFNDENEKIKVVLFTEKLIEIIHNNIIKAKSIEITDPIKIEETYDGYNLIIGIYIDIEFKLKIIVKDESIDILPFTEEVFINFINLVLYDYYYFEKFQKTEPDEITHSVTKKKDTTIFEFTIENL